MSTPPPLPDHGAASTEAASTGAPSAGTARSAGTATAQPWRRFVALGDSFTEGIGDPDPHAPGGHRGWADRVAEELGRSVPGFEYANLAIRGRLYQEIIDEQIEPAVALEPDLVSIFAGGNDVIRGRDPDEIAAAMDTAVGRLAETGATIVLWTGPDVGSTPVFHLIRGRTAIYNENMRAIAQRHGAAVVDLWSLRSLTHEGMWAEDRLHFSPEGHLTIAAHVLDTLGVEHTLQPHDLGDPTALPWREARQQDLHWARVHFGPWVVRRLRRQSSGSAVRPKRPCAAPVFGRPMPPGTSASDR